MEYCVVQVKTQRYKQTNNTYLKSFTNSFDMKSIPSGDTLAKDSSSKSYLAIVTFAIVSISVSPINGDKPEILFPTPTHNTNTNTNTQRQQNHHSITDRQHKEEIIANDCIE